MDFGGLATLLGLPLTAAPLAISLLSGRSPWRQLERAAKIAPSLPADGPALAELRRLQLTLIQRLNDRLTVSIRRRAILLGATMVLIGSAVGLVGAIMGLTAVVLPLPTGGRIALVLLAIGVAATVGGVASTVLSLLALRLLDWRQARREVSERPIPPVDPQG